MSLYDRVLWTEKYVRLVHDMYESSTTVEKFTVGVTDGFKVPFLLCDGQSDR